MKKFKASVRRRMYWLDEVEHSSYCPECTELLVNEYHIYMLMTRSTLDVDGFIVGDNSGCFCSNCPVVVLDRSEFAEAALMGDNSVESFKVLGLVDIDSIPESKKEIPLGDDGNPIPLVEFLPILVSSKQVKVGRNSVCPCGSGKKYKKCCMGNQA